MSSLLGRMLARVGAIDTDTAELDARVEEMIAPFTQPRSGWMRSPPAGIRQLRDHTRRVDLTRDRSQHAQRPENALIKLSTVATNIIGVSGRAIIEALIAGRRDPHALAGLARGRMKVKHAVLVHALTGRFDDHHGEPARTPLDSYDAPTGQIGKPTSRIEELIADIPEARGVDAGGPPPRDGRGPGRGGPVGDHPPR